MLKKRLIPILLLMDDRVVKTQKFSSYKDVGAPKTAASVYESQEADEIFLLNISQKREDFSNLVKYTKIISENTCMPLTVGGGIKNFSQAQELFNNGADKIVLNSINYTDISVLKQTANVYGAQAVVASIDVKIIEKEDYTLYSERGQLLQSDSLKDHIVKCDTNGAGEFLIQSIDRDGMMQGLDLKLGERILDITSSPVVLAGGVGSYADIGVAFEKLDLSGVACASIFHFTDSNPIRASAYLANAGFPIKKV